ncbi:hypothetical protein ES319_1Z183900v1 [Gossypium barbadense]|uniref:Uncharacterized protein n=1 Tax=Gossypium barbadense TaxID=3634 RepID=A0A5J5NCW8_GOSBA|nr:hypothetical protein ES319_1Z183900v1 [Gossypium barbadense]
MLGVGEETPSRFDLLSIVKKHSNLLGKTVVEEERCFRTLKWTVNFCTTSSICYFVRGKESKRRQDDDLLFFREHGFNDTNGVAPYFVRRWALELDKLVGESFSEVDWRRSFYLNMIAPYFQVLRNRQVGQDTPLSSIYKIVKTVYASPAVETTPAYPDICFAIDDFDSTFDAVVLTDTDLCYCVLLNALDGAGFPSETDKMIAVPVWVLSQVLCNNLFVLAHDQPGWASRFGSFLLYMKGPGGLGEVEVAVSGVTDQSKQYSGPFSPIKSKRGLRLGSMFRKAASVLLQTSEEMIPLKCCLMSITLPWEHIAHDLLFKRSPPVNL